MENIKTTLNSPTRLALGFLQFGKEIGSGGSGGRFPRPRGTGSPACGEAVPPAPVPSSPSIEPVPQAYEPQFPKPQDFWKKIALAILDERPRIFQKMTLAVWCGLYVVIIWFDGLSVWIYAVLWFLYGFMCFLYGVMWFKCGLMWFYLVSMWFHVVSIWFCVVSKWFHVLSMWFHVVLVWLHVVVCGLYVGSCGFHVVAHGFYVVACGFYVVP